MSRLTRFQEDRFGVSFHWGLYSILARGEWVRSIEKIPKAEYAKLVREFEPDRFDAGEWARAVKAAGGRYSSLTAKHHDGFCLWPTATTDFASRRDYVGEFVAAMRAEGIRPGLYFSLLDWNHPDFPHYGDRQHPERLDPAWKGATHDWDRFLRFMQAQLRELLTNYGELAQVILDFSYWDFTGERWAAREVVAMIRELQPNAVFNDRLGGQITGDPRPWVGDYDSPELNVPTLSPTNARGERVPFETWITLNNSWGYNASDRHYKSATDVIHALVNCVSKGGNLMVNLSPDARGAIPRESTAILEEVGEWLALNGESIFGASDAGLPKPDWGRWTRKGDALYAHFFEIPLGHATLSGLRGKVAEPRFVPDGSAAFLTDFWNDPVQTFGGPDDIFFNWGLPAQNTFPLPDARDSVFRFRLTSADEEQMIRARLEAESEARRRREPWP